MAHSTPSRAIRLLLLAGLALALPGCGLQPLYSGGGSGAVAQGLASVAVSPIPGRDGWLVRQALTARMGAGTNARYRLDVRISDQLEGLGLLANNTVGRERRTLRARYQLVDVASGEILLDASAGADAGINVATSEYATVAAEQTALENLSHLVADKIVMQVAAKLLASAGAAPASAAAAGAQSSPAGAQSSPAGAR